LLTFRPGGPLAATVSPSVTHTSLQPFDFALDWFAPGLFATAARLQLDVILCMGRMANCYAGGLQRRQSQTAVVATMRTGKPLPALFRRSLRLARHIVANSHDARANLISQHSLPYEKISVIHNSLVFPGESSLARNDTLRAQHGATSATTVLLNVAMFRPEKNQRELIEIAAGLPATLDWQLWLAGDGPARPGCESLAARLDVAERVRFLGFHRNPSSLYAAADLAVHASWSEALSNFLIEAQAHGLPAVAYDAQGIRECFVPDLTGWAITRDRRDAFRDAVTRLITEPTSTRASRSSEARTFARGAFDPARQVAAYLDLFQSLVDRPAP
jgi:glycosyltransferase involved in cell wall biosynthesis